MSVFRLVVAVVRLTSVFGAHHCALRAEGCAAVIYIVVWFDVLINAGIRCAVEMSRDCPGGFYNKSPLKCPFSASKPACASIMH